MPKGVHNKKGRHSLLFYAQVYGCNREQMGRAVREGVDPEDPAAVDTWLKTRTRNIRRINPNLPNGNGPGPENGQNPMVRRAEGLTEGMIALREAEADLSVRYMNAIRSGNADAIRFWRDEWTNIFEQLRRVETANPEIQREKGEAVRVSEVRTFVTVMITQFRAALDAAPERLAHKLVGLSAVQIIDELKKEHRIILRALKEWPYERAAPGNRPANL